MKSIFNFTISGLALGSVLFTSGCYISNGKCYQAPVSGPGAHRVYGSQPWNRCALWHRHATPLSAEYGISLQSEEAIIRLASVTDSKDLPKATQALGVTPLELLPLAKLELPSPESMKKIADHLNENYSSIHKMFSDFVDDEKAEN